MISRSSSVGNLHWVCRNTQIHFEVQNLWLGSIRCCLKHVFTSVRTWIRFTARRRPCGVTVNVCKKLTLCAWEKKRQPDYETRFSTWGGGDLHDKVTRGRHSEVTGWSEMPIQFFEGFKWSEKQSRNLTDPPLVAVVPLTKISFSGFDIRILFGAAADCASQLLQSNQDNITTLQTLHQPTIKFTIWTSFSASTYLLVNMNNEGKFWGNNCHHSHFQWHKFNKYSYSVSQPSRNNTTWSTFAGMTEQNCSLQVCKETYHFGTDWLPFHWRSTTKNLSAR